MNIMRTTRFSFRTFMTEVACVLTMMLFMLHTTYAATVAFSVEVPSTTVVVGDTVEIKVSINAADQALSSYSYNITYDSTLLKAVSGGTVESEGTVSYSQANVKPGDAMTATFTFTAIASGTASIETSAVEVISDTEESIDMTPSYNSVTISDKSAAASTEAASSTVSDTGSEAEPATPLALIDSETKPVVTEDEVGTLTEADQNASAPADTLVSVHSNNNTYNIIPKPNSVSVPTGYLPVKINLNDTDIRAYMKESSSNTVLLYAATNDGHQGWYFFNPNEGTFLDATDLIEETDSLSSFIDKHKFVIMLIAIIVLVILVVVIIILAVSLKGLIADYEAQIDKLKKDNEEKESTANETSEAAEPSAKAAEHVRMPHHDNSEVPTINNKALFPGDNEVIHESYADSDYDNQVSPDEDDVIHTDDYDDTAFEDVADDSEPIDSAFDVKEDTESTESKIQASLDEIDAALESAKKYKD